MKNGGLTGAEGEAELVQRVFREEGGASESQRFAALPQYASDQAIPAGTTLTRRPPT